MTGAWGSQAGLPSCFGAALLRRVTEGAAATCCPPWQVDPERCPGVCLPWQIRWYSSQQPETCTSSILFCEKVQDCRCQKGPCDTAWRSCSGQLGQGGLLEPRNGVGDAVLPAQRTGQLPMVRCGLRPTVFALRVPLQVLQTEFHPPQVYMLSLSDPSMTVFE